MSPRTLREHLYHEGLSFRAVLLELRMTLAKHYLLSTNMMAEQLAYFLGYSQHSGFFRAFKGYYGRTTKMFVALAK